MPLAAGTKLSAPLAMSATLITWPAVTGTPLSRRLPLAGSVSMRTAARLWPASASLKKKFDWASVTVVSSVPATTALALFGGVFEPTLTVSVALAVPPLPSLTV